MNTNKPLAGALELGSAQAAADHRAAVASPLKY